MAGAIGMFLKDHPNIARVLDAGAMAALTVQSSGSSLSIRSTRSRGSQEAYSDAAACLTGSRNESP